MGNIVCVFFCLASMIVSACTEKAADQDFLNQSGKTALEKRGKGPTPVAQEIDWQAVERHPRLSAELSTLVPEHIANLPIPVLLPPQKQWLTNAKFTNGPGWYAASVRIDNHHVYISGNGVAMRVTGQESHSMPGLRVFASEGTMNATWRQFGVTYLLNVECDDPEHDAHCTDKQYIRSLVENLVVSRSAP